MSDNNPFKNLPSCSRIGRATQNNTCDNFYKRPKYLKSEGDKVPGFLLRRLQLTEWSKSKIKSKF